MKAMEKEAKFFVLCDLMGDLVRSGPLQWKIDRFRTEDLKDHIFDLILMTKEIKPYLPSYINTDRMIDYAIVHDLAEVITGDITGFDGVSPEEKERVTKIAIDYLKEMYGDINNFRELVASYEEKKDIEAKVLKLLDSISSCNAFVKYDSEHKIDMDNPAVNECLRCNPGVLKLREQYQTLKEVFYIWHSRKIKFTDEEIAKYNISREDANKIVYYARTLMDAIYNQFEHIDEVTSSFPKDATKYKHINEN